MGEYITVDMSPLQVIIVLLCSDYLGYILQLV